MLTMIAAISMVGMFLVLIVTIYKYGVDAALRLWAVLWPLSNVNQNSRPRCLI